MRWPADHPLVRDPELSRHRAGVASVSPGSDPGTVLRHVEGRRVALRIHHGTGEAVLKVFARPRARGNDRRLRLIAAADPHAAPTPLGADATGHVGLVAWQRGTPFGAVPDPGLPAAAHAAGRALHRLHRVDAVLDRAWDVQDEIAALRRSTSARVAALIPRTPPVSPAADGAPVCAHRDFHPGQVVLDGDRARIIDLDDAAMAPAGLDVGNFTAHLWRDAALEVRPRPVVAAAVRAFLDGYGRVPADHAEWEDLSLLRLAALAEHRFSRPGDAARILAHRADRG